MTLASAIRKHLESESAHALEIIGHVRDRAEGMNKAGRRVTGHPQPITKLLEGR
jgi:hypothetical protein